MNSFFQHQLQLNAFPAGYHLITDEIEEAIPEIRKIQTGFLQVFIQHTSAALTINENADPTVRKDFQTFVNELIPESYPRFIHTYEGPDDMPAHIKASFFDSHLQIPITGGKLNLGTWQGIYLCEFRKYGGGRRLILTAFGELR
ncbi:secondary thiamine-phosphate synthase enzyme YjbQ [Algoriphagus halophytocola]|uniref:Secondary thiamine-phosphate synthase enzyme YjbQ n=1 Tax=Algoriphagus halophytocola TaxID=2991499 RepID=A0ABY6MDM5_9BACT|nr:MULTISPECIES: secondary thiamine-phosphate synthase enzyme YjbQ [unclassified Algoriphagus]UZD21648.1 secondary thiamine-phosphate synthase enzyme YjbQ [Algoriphagus sp. TR-M5]WBL42860.1 secondary thiamine-phosphate synthase enzyme YjbQ [Algoriphagus sp. TR-M9]